SRHRAHPLPAGRADDGPSLRRRRAVARGLAPAGRARQHRGRDRAQPRRAQDRGLGDRPRARGRREGGLRDRRGHPRTADREPRFGDGPVPARAARESSEGQKVRGLVERRPALAAHARRGRLNQQPESPANLGYGALMRVAGFPRLVVSLFLGRIAGQMLTVAFVLFVLARYHSPQLAGAATFLLIFPGLLLSPIAGALLDRYGKARLITVDYIVVATTFFMIAGLSAGHRLPPALLLAICVAASLTGPLSAAGARSIFPTLVPGHLWERANALDSS